MKKLILTAVLLLLQQYLRANIRHFYIELNGDEIEIGETILKPYHKIIRGRYKFDQVPQEVIDEILPPKRPEDVLYYFHSLYGGVTFYHKTSLKFFNTLDSNHIQKVISIVWHARKLTYSANWHQAPDQGASLAPLLHRCLIQEAKTNNLLCHSMGHRVMEGMIVALSQPAFKFDRVILAAADLNADSLSHSLKSLPFISRQIIIFVNNQDRLLRLSRRALGRDRLGLQGPASALPANVLVERITGEFPYDPSGHIYFKSAPAAKKIIRQVFLH